MLQKGETITAPGVIWITGFSAAGKTTVGRKVESNLRDLGFPTILLDGDDLRSIFGNKWGYERVDRIELAHVYFRLSNHLASQGYTIIIAAVAMYQEVREWVRNNVIGAFEVFLDVPQPELEKRDAQTKRIYQKIGNLANLYDLPDDDVFRIENFGSAPEAVAAEIVSAFLRQGATRYPDMGRTRHWGDYYARKTSSPVTPSPFASEVAKRLGPSERLLEIGCGNGRDASFFDSEGHHVTAIDASVAAIDLCQNIHKKTDIHFLYGTLPELTPNLERPFDVAYSRFVLHAMPIREEIDTLRCAASLLKLGGSFFIECRSINDPLAREGEVISPTERICGHYRRFIVKEELMGRLTDQGFTVIEAVESNGLAKFGDEDPVVVRIMATKD
jgi:adenylylsulfate kinase-like enzyme/SAM-dependent methyltransferase